MSNIFVYKQFSNRYFYPKKGWKIHISASWSNWKKILDLTLFYAKKMEFDFKYVKEKYFDYILGKKSTPYLLGKFITIYPYNKKNFIELVEKLWPIFKRFKGPSILTDRKYRDSIIQYRYGFIKVSEEEFSRSYRHLFFYLPLGLKDPFINEKNKDIENEFYLNNKYKILDVIETNSHGNIFKCLDIREGKNVVIKEAREYVGVSKYSDPIKLRTNEINIFKKTKLAPKYLGKFKINSSIFFVFEFIPGKLLNFISPITVANYGIVEGNWEQISTNYFILKNNCSFLWEQGIIINDFHPRNFMLYKKNIYFIDMDFAKSSKNSNITSIPNYLAGKIANLKYEKIRFLSMWIRIILSDSILKFKLELETIFNFLIYTAKIGKMPLKIYNEIKTIIENSTKLFNLFVKAEKYVTYYISKKKNIAKAILENVEYLRYLFQKKYFFQQDKCVFIPKTNSDIQSRLLKKKKAILFRAKNEITISQYWNSFEPVLFYSNNFDTGILGLFYCLLLFKKPNNEIMENRIIFLVQNLALLKAKKVNLSSKKAIIFFITSEIENTNI